MQLDLTFAAPTTNGDITSAIFGLVGVFLGAALSTVAQYYFQRRQERDRRLSLAYSVAHKVKTFSNTIGQMCNTIAAARARQKKPPFWCYLEPHRSISPPGHFTAEELSIFYSNKDALFADELSDLESLHNGMLEIMREYSERREALDVIIETGGGITTQGEGAIFDTSILSGHPLQVGKLASLANHLLRFAEEGAPHTTCLLKCIGPKLRLHLKDDRFDLPLGPR